MRKPLALILALSSVSLLGCNGSKSPSQKAEANKEWNGARSAVLASLANEQYKAGNFDKCRKTVDDALKLTPQNEPLHVLSAKLAIETGQLERAEQELSFARVYDPKDAQAFYLSGVVAQRWQKPQEALGFYQQAYAKAPAELAYLLAQAEMLVALDRPDEAMKLLKAKVTYFEHSGAIRDAVGQILAQQNRWAEAAAMFRDASILAENDPGIRERLALALYHVKDYRESADLLSRLVADEPYSKRADLFAVLGECQLKNGKPREARYSFETASQFDPYNAHTLQSLGRAAFEAGDARRAELALTRSAKLDPAQSETHLLLGYVRLRQGRFAEALTDFRKASALDPRDTVSLCLIGYALQQTGHPGDAAPYFGQALRLKPGDDLASQLMAGVDPAD